MKTLWHIVLSGLALLGGFIGFFFDAIDWLFYTLVALFADDYVSGMMKAIVNRKLPSDSGAKSITKKRVVFILVGLAHLVDAYVLGTGRRFIQPCCYSTSTTNGCQSSKIRGMCQVEIGKIFSQAESVVATLKICYYIKRYVHLWLSIPCSYFVLSAVVKVVFRTFSEKNSKISTLTIATTVLARNFSENAILRIERSVGAES
jgi:toxin secretion/phage lysis holin